MAASATPRILELLGSALTESGPHRVLELDFAGIHAVPLRLAGFEVVVVETDAAYVERARARAGDVLTEVPPGLFDAAVAPAETDLSGVSARRVVLVGQDGSAWSRDLS